MQEAVRYIGSNVDADLSLTALAQRFQVSEFQFHRLFQRQTGETPAKFVERIRLQQAAHALLFHEGSVLDTGLAHGYQSHETFTRAFRRRFGLAPKDFRRGRWIDTGDTPTRRGNLDHGYRLSPTRLQRLRECHVLKTRHLGPYESVPDSLWQGLYAHLQAQGEPLGQCLGIGLDSPSEVAPAALRFDACIRLSRPIDPGRAFECAQLESAWYAVCTHVGDFASLPEAYPTIYAQALAIEDFDLVGLPVMEVYHGGLVDEANPDNQTDIYIPLREKMTAAEP